MVIYLAYVPGVPEPCAGSARRISMDGRITQITLVVTDQTRSLEFFTEKVGFEKKTDVTPPGGYRWVTVGPKGQDLELALFQVGSAVDPAQREWSKHWSPATAPPIVLRVPDVRKTHQELSQRGVEFVQPPKDYPWGTAATFKDPDGNLFSMSQPPAEWPKK
jgi:predicted enzyme related to lactoylglutathione lyase